MPPAVPLHCLSGETDVLRVAALHVHVQRGGTMVNKWL
jgi:hypothetical protein